MLRLVRIMVRLVFVVGLIGLAACSPAQPAQPTADPAMIYTQAAQTVQAQLAQTQAAMPTATPTLVPSETPIPSPTLPPTEVPSPTEMATLPPLPTQPVLQPSVTQPVQQVGDHATFLYNVPGDGSTFDRGQKFLLAIGFQNSGTTTWTKQYRLVFMGGAQMSGVTVIYLEKEVKPGQKYEFDIAQAAPDKVGSYISRWKFVNASGVYIAEMYIKFSVK